MNLSDKLAELACGIKGHEMLRRVEGTRIFLECLHCTKEHPGLEVPSTRPMGFTSGDIVDMYEFLRDVEMGLGCGG